MFSNAQNTFQKLKYKISTRPPYLDGILDDEVVKLFNPLAGPEEPGEEPLEEDHEEGEEEDEVGKVQDQPVQLVDAVPVHVEGKQAGVLSEVEFVRN